MRVTYTESSRSPEKLRIAPCGKDIYILSGCAGMYNWIRLRDGVRWCGRDVSIVDALAITDLVPFRGIVTIDTEAS